jgi:hypothetical protein
MDFVTIFATKNVYMFIFNLNIQQYEKFWKR